MTNLHLDLGAVGYDITVGSGLLPRAGEFLNLDRRVLIVTDSGVPAEYAIAVAASAKEAKILTVPMGETSKSLAVLERVLTAMCDLKMTRQDCAVAVGGGVVGDLVGFAAASYMRGIDFYNVPTTVLSEVDSSIGGKTAVNLGQIKNIVGAFHQPRGVLIDTDTLKTLPKRQVANGLAEAVKMSLTSDKELFEMFERLSYDEIIENIEKIIVASLKIKRAVVEEDPREMGIRKILNFGHTLGHGIEALEELRGLYHGECVALGMLPMASGEVRERLIPVLKKLGLPTEYKGDIKAAAAYAAHDKKSVAGGVSAVLVGRVGEYEIRKMTLEELEARALAVF